MKDKEILEMLLELIEDLSEDYEAKYNLLNQVRNLFYKCNVCDKQFKEEKIKEYEGLFYCPSCHVVKPSNEIHNVYEKNGMII